MVIARTTYGLMKFETHHQALNSRFVGERDVIWSTERAFTDNVTRAQLADVLQLLGDTATAEKLQELTALERNELVVKTWARMADVAHDEETTATLNPEDTTMSDRAKAAKPAKKKAAAAAGATNGEAKAARGRRSAFNADAKIKVLAKENPKREGSRAHERFALYKDGMTVGAFLEKGGSLGDLRYDTKHGFVQIAS